MHPCMHAHDRNKNENNYCHLKWMMMGVDSQEKKGEETNSGQH